MRRTLPASVGGATIFVSPDAALRYWRRRTEQYDPHLLRSAMQCVCQGDVVWDIGANVGLFSFAAAGLAGQYGNVLAIEPDTWLVDLLRRSVRANSNGLASVEVLPAAVSDHIDIKRFHIAQRGRSANYLDGFGLTDTGGSRETQLVPSVTLDWLLDRFPAPKVLKIDVEGAEAHVLVGAKRVLREVRPLMILEIGNANQAVVTQRLKSEGYSLFDMECAAGERQPLAAVAWNTLAIPEGHRMLDRFNAN